MPQPYPHGELVIVIDCSDLDRSARFWSGVLGYTPGPPDPDGNEFCVLQPPGISSA
jgi:catechol 2,3-dioxygenase-like lactoylglutathione lyase family enzyme